MAGLYSHTSRATGITLTANIYNTDHQNHIDNQEFDQINDHSANTTEMQATVDPGEVSSESLATDGDGEFDRLRFIIKEMKGTAQWYVTNPVTAEGSNAVAARVFS